MRWWLWASLFIIGFMLGRIGIQPEPPASQAPTPVPSLEAVNIITVNLDGWVPARLDNLIGSWTGDVIPGTSMVSGKLPIEIQKTKDAVGYTLSVGSELSCVFFNTTQRDDAKSPVYHPANCTLIGVVTPMRLFLTTTKDKKRMRMIVEGYVDVLAER